MSDSDGMSREETERALEQLHTSSFGWAMTCCRFDRDEAADVLQISYLKILEGKACFNGHSSLRTWVFGLVRRTALERRRRRLLREIALARWVRSGIAPSPSPTPEIVSEQERSAGHLRSLLARLSRRQRELLHLVFYEELSIAEAATALSISIGTARIHYQRGKTALRAQLSATRSGEMEAVHALRERNRPEDRGAVPNCAAGGREVRR